MRVTVLLGLASAVGAFSSPRFLKKALAAPQHPPAIEQLTAGMGALTASAALQTGVMLGAVDMAAVLPAYAVGGPATWSTASPEVVAPPKEVLKAMKDEFRASKELSKVEKRAKKLEDYRQAQISGATAGTKGRVVVNTIEKESSFAEKQAASIKERDEQKEVDRLKAIEAAKRIKQARGEK